ncbi:aminotransferase class III-fold pyridoxal phosphate-dependent enzyme [Gammaproteobacteria bacterium]|nr:aminotransferase class III-fold pyridoxal phosphate-dependent enzyme [Gammaproteobacteria bacterium]
MNLRAEETDKKMGERSRAVRTKLISRTTKSGEMARKGHPSLAMEVVQTVDMPHQIYIDSAEGPYLTDLDGNQYIDLTCGFGPNVVGNKAPFVEEALASQIKKGWHYGIPGAEQARLAELIKESSSAVDEVMFCNSGSEATMFAFRAARALTGKRVIALFDGSYHGIHDYALVKAGYKSERSEPSSVALGAGIPEEISRDLMMMLPYRDENAYELIRRHKDDLALVVIEPVQSSNPRLDNQQFLEGLRDVCTECGVLLMFDEVISGFRIEYGGCQQYYNIKPDLVTYGKAAGGGMPIGVVAGSKRVMNTFSGVDDTPTIFAGGTFNGHPLTMVAGIAILEHLKENQEEIYPYLHEQGNRVASEINEFCVSNNIPAQMMNAGSMMHLIFSGESIESSRDIDQRLYKLEKEFYLHLLGHNVIVPGIHLAFISFAHKADVIDQVIDAFKRSFEDLREDGYL